MSRAALFYFSPRGEATARAAAAALGDGFTAELYAPKGNLKSLTTELFPAVDALIFVGACGIAVRAIAPHLVSKVSDPAVLVIDEAGNFVISLLSGHIGGANDLARALASSLNATPVITTATDVNRRFSADAWAARQGLHIDSIEAAKVFSAAILRGDLPFFTEFPVEGACPGGLYPGREGPVGLCISCRDEKPFSTTLLLIPPVVHLGIGCKKNISAQAISKAVEAALEGADIRREAVRDISSIDVKREEAGLLEYARDAGLPLRFYSAEALNAAPGEFTGSEFVRKTVGVDNVCERAAALSAGPEGTIILKKTSLDGVTVAAAREKWSVRFE